MQFFVPMPGIDVRFSHLSDNFSSCLLNMLKSFLFVFNWNYSSLCLNNTLCLNQKNEVFIPHITKIFLLISAVLTIIPSTSANFSIK